ncbi:uncharacterized protein LOC123296350 [Chrysoperla carnea]|uniref:uncharacterized protein LOC123296350 n=1 Tax=Chrysoperla carnea TaxID=189513 RepID=UPI001D08B466|nr:uncharacterized protein LOC123296350 [Chrysoperla carnea]
MLKTFLKLKIIIYFSITFSHQKITNLDQDDEEVCVDANGEKHDLNTEWDLDNTKQCGRNQCLEAAGSGGRNFGVIREQKCNVFSKDQYQYCQIQPGDPAAQFPFCCETRVCILGMYLNTTSTNSDNSWFDERFHSVDAGDHATLILIERFSHESRKFLNK